MLLLLVACNQPPGAPGIAIVPTDPRTADDLEVVVQGDATDANGDDVTYTYAWFVDDAPRTDLTSTIVPAAETTKGETWKVVVTPSDGKADGTYAEASVIIGNTPPAASLALDPLSPSGADEVVATATTEDADGDAITVTWAWTRDGVDVGLASGTLPAGTAARGEAWTVTATPDDGEDAGEPATVGFTVGNAPPTLADVILGPEGATVTDTLTATFVGADDADGDVVSVLVMWAVDGVGVFAETVDADASSTLSGVFSRGSEIVVTAMPDDGYGDWALSPTATLVIADSPPSITGARVSPDPLYVDSVVTCVGDGWVDADGDAEGYRTTWTVAGSVVSTEAELPAGSFARGDTVSCALVPDDGELLGAEVASAAVTVSNSPPACASAAITIGPDPATLADTLSVVTDGYAGCADADGDAMTQVYDWQVDGASVATTATLPAGTAARGQSVTLVTGWTDGWDTGAAATSNTLVITNVAPVVSGVALSPSTVYTNSVVSATVSTTDAEGDVVALDYAWTVDGVAAGTGATLDGAAFAKGQTVALTVTPTDGFDTGTPASTSVVVANSAPAAPTVSVLPAAPRDADALVCSVTAAASDADGDAVGYTFAWSVGGVAYTGATTTTFTGDTVPASATTTGQAWTCTVTPTDGTDTGTPGTASATIGCDADNDGYTDVACGGDDCDDTDDTASPGEEEVCGDGVDNDCDDASYPCGVNGDFGFGDQHAVLYGTTGLGTVGIGDFDGDGQDDVAVGTVRSTVEIWFGPLTEGAHASSTADVTLSGGSGWTISGVGSAVEAIPDLDGDGDDELVTQGTPLTTISYGLWLIEGSPTLADTTLTAATAFDSNSRGFTAGGAGDFDGDGYADMFVGDSTSGSTDTLTVYLGDPWGTYATVDWTNSQGDFGDVDQVVSAGDLDGDGLDDLLAGIDPTSGSTGIVPLYGDTAPVGAAVTVASDAWITLTGPGEVCAPGDVDGDGYADIGAVDASSVYVFLGPPTTTAVTTSSTYATFTGDTCAAGDTDADGEDELFVWDGGYTQSSEARRYLYPLTAGTPEATIEYAADLTIGEVTGDGYDDVVWIEGSLQSYAYILTGGEW